MKDTRPQSQIIIYQSKSGSLDFRGDYKKETIWATQAQISELFKAERSVVTKHIRNILQEKELEQDLVCAKFAHTATDGKTYQTKYYNLDVILAVGYRTSTNRAIQFRQWATKTLRNHIIRGYTLNKKRIGNNYSEFLKAVESIKKLLPANSEISARETLELVKLFAGTWLSLDAYDKGKLPRSGANIKQVTITAQELQHALAELKADLLKRNGASELFGQEKQTGGLAGIIGTVFQSAFGTDAYTTVEAKAAHLLYFIIKNHPFTDGNKRSGAFAFVWFLNKVHLLNPAKISPEALTALTLLVAESKPQAKEQIIGLLMLLLKK